MLPSSSKSGMSQSETDEELDINFAGMAYCLNVACGKGEWILDSEASDHMTPYATNLDKVKITASQSLINLPNGQTSLIASSGSTALCNGLMLKEVLCVPFFKHNLLSINKLIKDNNCFITFFGTFCLIQDSFTRIIKGVGRACNGLYYLLNIPIGALDPRLLTALVSIFESRDFTHNKITSVASVSHTVNSTSVNHELFAMWHNRLGHAPLGKLKHVPSIPKDILLCKDGMCITCPMAKFTKVPYPISESKALTAFELLHIDIWGLYRVPTKNKHRFFLTVVDDYTRASWVFLLYQKLQSLATLQTFIKFAEVHFGATVKTLRSDNALEFDNSPYRDYFASKGILHQTSCVDKPQQNGRVERKHRHLLEIARALRF